MKILTVRHSTVYRYRQPVVFGEHRLMFRPRDSHDMRLRETRLEMSPPASVRWLHDVFGNSVTIATFEAPASELRLVSVIEVEHWGIDNPDFSLEDYAHTLPFSYSPEEVPDLGRTIERHYPDPDRDLDKWTARFLEGPGRKESYDVLVAMTRAIREEFTYETRSAPGVQSPAETLQVGTGTCRDFALFLMEAARTLGIAARFVTGYLYDPAVEGMGAGVVGAGATHAWTQVYLPGAGWVEFDPTNGTIGGTNLIRVGVTRDPQQAIPVQGSYRGAADDFLGMEVEVQVTATAPSPKDFALPPAPPSSQGPSSS